MKIEHCEWSKDNGEDIHGNTIWYCAHRTFCPYKKCELPAKEKPKPKPEPEPLEEPERILIDWERILPIVRDLRNKRWTLERIAEKLNVKYTTLATKCTEAGIKGGKGEMYDWDKIVCAALLMKQHTKRNWLQIAEELNVSESALHRQILKRG